MSLAWPAKQRNSRTSPTDCEMSSFCLFEETFTMMEKINSKHRKGLQCVLECDWVMRVCRKEIAHHQG